MPSDFIYHDPGAPLRMLKRAATSAYGSMTAWADVLNDCADEIHRNLPDLLPARLPRPSRVSEWAGGTRPIPLWCSVAAGRLLLQTFMPRAYRTGQIADFLDMAGAICPVYVGYLSALLDGADYRALVALDDTLARMVRIRFMLNQYPGKGGAFPVLSAPPQVAP